MLDISAQAFERFGIVVSLVGGFQEHRFNAFQAVIAKRKASLGILLLLIACCHMPLHHGPRVFVRLTHLLQRSHHLHVAVVEAIM
jgi:hypothetical protein